VTPLIAKGKRQRTSVDKEPPSESTVSFSSPSRKVCHLGSLISRAYLSADA
jgi:hypothetical protein